MFLDTIAAYSKVKRTAHTHTAAEKTLSNPIFFFIAPVPSSYYFLSNNNSPPPLSIGCCVCALYLFDYQRLSALHELFMTRFSFSLICCYVIHWHICPLSVLYLFNANAFQVWPSVFIFYCSHKLKDYLVWLIFFLFFFSYRDSHLMIGIPLSRVLCRIFFSTHTHTEHKMRGKNREESCFSFLIIFGEGAILKRAREGGRCELAVSYLLL